MRLYEVEVTRTWTNIVVASSREEAIEFARLQAYMLTEWEPDSEDESVCEIDEEHATRCVGEGGIIFTAQGERTTLQQLFEQREEEEPPRCRLTLDMFGGEP